MKDFFYIRAFVNPEGLVGFKNYGVIQAEDEDHAYTVGNVQFPIDPNESPKPNNDFVVQIPVSLPVGVEAGIVAGTKVAKIWEKALGYPIREFAGRTNGECIEPCQKAINKLDDPIYFGKHMAFHPDCDEKDYLDATKYLKVLLVLCQNDPESLFEITG